MTHEARLALIYRPFFIHNLGPSYPHGGTAVADTFQRDPDDPRIEWAERQHTDPNNLNPWPVRFKGTGRPGTTAGCYRFAERPAWAQRTT